MLAELASGGESLAPAGQKVPAVATFTYTAPAERDASGWVDLEARSKRGVARAGLSFDTNRQRGFHVSAPWGVFDLTGRTCDPTKPFELAASSPDGDVKLSFTPKSEQAGSAPSAEPTPDRRSRARAPTPFASTRRAAP